MFLIETVMETFYYYYPAMVSFGTGILTFFEVVPYSLFVHVASVGKKEHLVGRKKTTFILNSTL